MDVNGDGVGDHCEADYGPDFVENIPDKCLNYSRKLEDFRFYQTLLLNPQENPLPDWVIYNKGSELVQKANSAPGIVVGYEFFGGVDFEGEFYVDTEVDDGFIGFVFGYQDSSNFYIVMWKRTDQSPNDSNPFNATAGELSRFFMNFFRIEISFSESSIQIKLVNSSTGPGEMLRHGLWHAGDTEDQVKLLWKDPSKIGWKNHTFYHWQLIHRPKIGLIRLRMFEGENMVTDSGNIFDSTLKGGRLGVFTLKQQLVIFADLFHRCNGRQRFLQLLNFLKKKSFLR